MSNQARTRLEWLDGKVKIGESIHSQETVIEMLRQSPEQFSPNVILRPVYQETVLPNLCYVGGSGELAYWLQLKPVFDAAPVVYPMLQLRVSMQLVHTKQLHKMKKLGFDFPTFSNKLDKILGILLSKLSSRQSVTDLTPALQEIRLSLIAQAQAVDSTLIASAEAQVKRIEKLLSAFEEKLKRNERKIHASTFERVQKLHHELFPSGTLQERHDNFFPHYVESNGSLIEKLIAELDVLKHEFMLHEL